MPDPQPGTPPSSPPPGFDVTAAAQEGHSSDDILNHLVQSRGFNLQGALQEGYTKDQIVQYLAAKPARAAAAPAGDGTAATPSAPVVQPAPSQVPGPGAGSKSASGFGAGVNLTPPPYYSTQAPGEDRINFAHRQRAQVAAENTAYVARETERQKAEVEAQARLEETRGLSSFNYQQEQQRIRDTVKGMQDQGIWPFLSKRQQGEVLRGSKDITPERQPQNVPGYVSGKTILAADPGATSALGEPIRPEDFHRLRILPDGSREFMPVAGGTTKRSFIDAKDGKSYLATYDRNGNELGREETINPLTLPQVTSGTSTTAVQIENPVTHRLEVVQVPVAHAGTTQRVIPGRPAAAAPATGTVPGTTVPLTPPPAPYDGAAATPRPAATLLPGPRGGPAAGPTTPKSNVTSPTPAPGARPDLPPNSRVIGDAPQQQKQDVENPLTPAAQSIVLKIQPQIATLQRLKQQMEPYKNSTSPMTTFLPRLAYNMGFASSQEGVDQMLSNLEMTDITAAASALSGSTRARQFVERALIHTPNAWKDSGKLMYGKVDQIIQRLNDITDEAKGPTGQRFPGLTPPPSAKKPLSEIFK